MTDSSIPTSPPAGKRLAQVTWPSGNETFDLAPIEEALKSRQARTMATREIRHGQDLTVQYEPTFNYLDEDSFSLTYHDAGAWITGDAAGQLADGDLGAAIYKLAFQDGAISQLSCIWTPKDGKTVAAKPKCKIIGLNEARLYESYFRSVRDREFRGSILGPDPRCAITGECETRVLDAAHIHQVKDGGADSADNGIALRKDLHALFDAHILCIDEQGVFTMEPMLASYADLFSRPRALAPEKTRQLLANIQARNAARPDW